MADSDDETREAARRVAEPGRLDYGPEPRFPWVLGLAWTIFGFWALYYVIDMLIPAFDAWSVP